MVVLRLRRVLVECRRHGHIRGRGIPHHLDVLYLPVLDNGDLGKHLALTCVKGRLVLPPPGRRQFLRRLARHLRVHFLQPRRQLLDRRRIVERFRLLERRHRLHRLHHRRACGLLVLRATDIDERVDVVVFVGLPLPLEQRTDGSLVGRRGTNRFGRGRRLRDARGTDTRRCRRPVGRDAAHGLLVLTPHKHGGRRQRQHRRHSRLDPNPGHHRRPPSWSAGAAQVTGARAPSLRSPPHERAAPRQSLHHFAVYPTRTGAD
ncbi:Uncharacterised protein [Mycobacteroides abscessus subsp. abscessus]|nr:Uncharacterised protein [Mycobacteroides abscessus subsp. abscessus]